MGGLLECALGMMIGQGLAYLLHRWEGAVRNVEAAMEVDEKDGLMVGEEFPPQYEVVDVVVVEEK
jgi:hypothetical protein